MNIKDEKERQEEMNALEISAVEALVQIKTKSKKRNKQQNGSYFQGRCDPIADNIDWNIEHEDDT